MSDQSSTENSAEVNDLAENGHAPEAELPLLAARTLSGDLRDAMLDLIRDQRTPWHKLPESQQAYVAERVQDRCAELVGQAVNLIAAREFPALDVLLEEIQFKEKGCSVKLGLTSMSRDLRHALVDSRGGRVMVVIADPLFFRGARGPAKIDKQALFDAPPVDGEDGAPVGPLFDAAAAEVAAEDPYARQTGYDDGYGGHQDHAARYPSGEPGHGDYWLGHAEGEQARALPDADENDGDGDGVIQAAEEMPETPTRRRGRPRKEAAEDRL